MSNSVEKRTGIRRKLSIFAVLSLGAGGVWLSIQDTGRGGVIGDCAGRETDLPATFIGDADYRDTNDPLVLIEYVKRRLDYPRGWLKNVDNVKTDDVVPPDPYHQENDDPADKIGEIVCRDGGRLVLTTAGEQLAKVAASDLHYQH